MHINGLLDNLFRKHNKELLHYATQRAGNVADDLVQESFLQLLNHPEPGGIGNHRAYLYKITNNLLNAHNRRLEIIAKYHEDCEELDSLPSKTPGLEMALHHEQILHLCLQVLKQLPAMQRNVFFLHRIDGLTYPQIAKMLGISRATVERHFVAAMESCVAASMRRRGNTPSR
ncbi:sigma-70 family RNA polymerase sigma factor [Methylomonas sp. SURF-2]|uniref:Sigma-70 family RNA polymerase sigma factor n=1 Tax=Methylomonas subterranea TaxID=2952225 RepID=A0ABT1THJ0_9GAMM|nr:sigma-70 family RNA polymerase sigma factor [Methylomonas sp. SURF-2]MCQ8104731.1 sigma-70 family RNA polymerase sigma factor [Methylomonas sp. SURF-2]